MIEICTKHLHEAPVPSGERLGKPTPADLDQLLLDCLAKDPADRPATAGVLRVRLEALGAFGTWSDRDARAWWSEYRQHLASSAPERTTPASDEMIANDLRGARDFID